MPEPVLLSRWNTLVEDFQIPPKTFYEYVEAVIKLRQLPDTGATHISLREGSIFFGSRGLTPGHP